MILPTKHTHFNESLIGFGAYILSIFEKRTTIDSIWEKYNHDFNLHKFTGKHSFDSLLMTLVFLHSIGAIIEEDGGVRKCVY